MATRCPVNVTVSVSRSIDIMHAVCPEFHRRDDVGKCFVGVADVHCLLAVEAGAIDAVVAAMRAHVDNAGTMEQACAALQTLSKNGCLPFICW